MALTSTSVGEINQTALAADINGGFFDSTQAGSTGVDMTYGATAAVISCAVTSTGNGTLTLTSGSVANTVLGNAINVGPFTMPPAAVSATTATTGGTLAASTAYSYEVTCVTASGLETNVSYAANVTTGSGTATNTVTITWNAVPNAASYNVYGRTSSSYLKTANVTTTSYTDTGSVTPTGAPPAANQTFIGIIDSWTNSTTIGMNTSNGAVPSFTAIAAVIGGPMTTVGEVWSRGSGNSIYIKLGSTSYTMAQNAGGSGGSFYAGPPNQNRILLFGYYLTRGDITETSNLANRPVIEATGTWSGLYAMQMFLNNNCCYLFDSIMFSGNSTSSLMLIYSQGQGNADNYLHNCLLKNFMADPLSGGSIIADYCEFTGNTFSENYVPPLVFTRCYSHHNTGYGFYSMYSYTYLTRCIAAFNSSDGINVGRQGSISGCISYKNSGYGIDLIQNGYLSYGENSIAYGNTLSDYVVGSYPLGNARNIAYGTSSYSLAGTPNYNFVQLTADPFVSASTLTASDNIADAFAAFALNDVAGGGALCRGAGTPANLDIGAVQSAATGGGGLIIPGRGFGRGF